MFYFGKDYIAFKFRKTISLISKIALVAFSTAFITSVYILFN